MSQLSKRDLDEFRRLTRAVVKAARAGSPGLDLVRKTMRQALKASKKPKPEKPTGGPPPFGYSSRNPLVENPDEQDMLRAIRELRECGVTFQKIAEELNAAGYRTRSGGTWVFQSVQRLPWNEPKGEA